LKYLSVVFFSLFVVDLSAYYVPCEPSLAANTGILTSKTQKEYSDIQSKLNILDNKYKKYNELQIKLNEELAKNLQLRERKIEIMLETVRNVKNINDITLLR